MKHIVRGLMIMPVNRMVSENSATGLWGENFPDSTAAPSEVPITGISYNLLTPWKWSLRGITGEDYFFPTDCRKLWYEK